MRIAICDDDKSDILLIQNAAKLNMEAICPNASVSFHLFLCGEGFLAENNREPFDMIFMDIELNTNDGTDGFSLAKRAMEPSGEKPVIVFVSHHESMVWISQRYRPLWFIRKNCLSSDMEDAIKQYSRLYLRGKKEIPIVIKGNRLYTKDILYIECEGHTITVFLSGGGSLTKYGSLREIEEVLTPMGFLRISKNYLVNPDCVDSWPDECLKLCNGSTLAVRRDRRKKIKAALIARGKYHV